MATVKVKFRGSSIQGKEGSIFYQVTHNRVTRQINTAYKLAPTEWDYTGSEIRFHDGMPDDRHAHLISVQNDIACDTSRLKHIIARLEHTGNAYTSETVVALYHSQKGRSGLQSFSFTILNHLRQIGKHRTAETYATTLNSFMRFRHGNDIALDDIDSSLMTEYEAYLLSTGLCQNTTSFYMRNLRAIYNRAVEQELTLQRNPFKHVYTGVDKTIKRAVPLTEIRRIRNMNLHSDAQLDYARDIFMFSFYTRGMSFIDMAFLKKNDLRNGILSYRRQKTKQQLHIRWEQPMQDIIDKYDTSCSPYLLPIIRDNKSDERRQYKNAVHSVNSNLKKIGRILGLSIPLTSYVARHAWASIAKSKNIPISIISEAMGHGSEITTRIYLASLDASIVDKANCIILNAL